MKKMTSALWLMLLMLVVSVAKLSAQSVDENGVLNSWTNPPAILRMPDNVIKVADNAFCFVEEDGWDVTYYPNPNITDIDFNNVQIIGKQAFWQLPRLKNIISAQYVKELMKQAFSDCASLKSIHLPSIEILGEESLANCNTLETIHLGKSLKSVAGKPFKNCPELQTITMDEGGEHYEVINNVLISKAEGLVCAAAYKTRTINIPKARVIGEYVFQNNTNVEQIIMDNVTELKDGAFCGAANLRELRLPKLEKLPSWSPMMFSGCSSLRVLDIHESDNFQGFGGATVPDEVGLRIYVANENVKSRIEGSFKKAEVIVGAPSGEIKSFLVNYSYNMEGGNMEAWGSNAKDVLSGSSLPQHSKISFKAIPIYGYQVGSFIVNGNDILSTLELTYGKAVYVVEDLNENINIEVTFVKEAKGDRVYFKASPIDAGKVTCSLEDGTIIESGAKVSTNSKLHFVATPILAGFELKDWKKDVGTDGASYETIPGTEGQLEYDCITEDGLDIRARFQMKENHAILHFKNQNEETGTLIGYVNNKEVSSLGAYPLGSMVRLSVTPVEGKNINTIKWFEITKDDFTEIKEYRDKRSIEFELSSRRDLSMLCSHEEKAKPGTNDAVIEGNHLLKWLAKGEVILPNDVEFIDKLAFRGSMELEKITLNSKVKSIGETAFLLCPELKEIVVPEDNPYFKTIDGVVYTKDGRTLVVYPGGKKDNVYTLPASVENILPGALITTPHIKEIKVASRAVFDVLGGALVRKSDKTMLYFPNAGFMKAQEPELVVDKSVEAVGRLALAYIPALTKIKLHKDFKRFDACACMAAGGLREIVYDENIQPSLNSIGDSAFFYNMSIEQLQYIPSLKHIGSEAFARGYNLRIVHIPANCKVDEKAFDYAMALMNVYSYSKVPPTITEQTITNVSNINDAILFVPKGCVDAYRQSVGWKMFKNILEFDAPEDAVEAVVDLSEHRFASLYYEDENLIVPEGVVVCTMHRDSAKDKGKMIGLKVGHVYKVGDVIPSSTGVVVFSKNKGAYVFRTTDREGVRDAKNMLSGKKDTNGIANAGEGGRSKYYMLSVNEKGLYGFYQAVDDAAPFKVGEHKAYVMISVESENP